MKKHYSKLVGFSDILEYLFSFIFKERTKGGNGKENKLYQIYKNYRILNKSKKTKKDYLNFSLSFETIKKEIGFKKSVNFFKKDSGSCLTTFKSLNGKLKSDLEFYQQKYETQKLEIQNLKDQLDVKTKFYNKFYEVKRISERGKKNKINLLEHEVKCLRKEKFSVLQNFLKKYFENRKLKEFKLKLKKQNNKLTLTNVQLVKTTNEVKDNFMYLYENSNQKTKQILELKNKIKELKEDAKKG